MHSPCPATCPGEIVQERQFARDSLFALAIALVYLKLHVRSKICVSEVWTFLLLKLDKYLVQDKFG